MKVVINSKYGGFSLSAAAMRRMVERKAAGVESDTVDGYTGGRGWYPGLDKFVDIGSGFVAQTFGDDATDVLLKDGIVYRWDRNNRTDSELILAVEEMGDEASGMCASLKVVEIPDSIEYQIEEYDGREWIAEKRATWQ